MVFAAFFIALASTSFEVCTAVQEAVLAFRGAHVLPMDQERVLRHHTVVIADGRIAALGPSAAIEIPEGAQIVDAAGKYLMPGLIDMHAHLLSDYEFPDELGPDELFVMAANGVTTARLMIGTPELLQLRQQVRNGEVPGPRLFVASPQFAGRNLFGEYFNGFEVKTPEEARAAVRRSVSEGYDFIKLTFFLKPDVYDAIIEEARAQNIRVIGHVGPQVGLQRALDASQQIEHLDQYLEALLADDSSLQSSVSGVAIWRPGAWKSIPHLDRKKIPEVVAATVKAGVWNTPTHAFLHTAFAKSQTWEEISKRPDMRFFHPEKVEKMRGTQDHYWNNVNPPQKYRDEFIAIRQELTLALYEAGAKLMIGSDAPEWFLHYGFTMPREMQSFVDAGLPAYASLVAATRNPAEFLGLKDTGTIAVGKRADLLLLHQNPLENVQHVSNRAGVVVNGRWFSSSTLVKRLDEISARFQAVKPRSK